ncbi:hypothetical protein [Occultella gossypii]|uniref:Uncharacterized protein n=1 Tax=Occultella gossypii TaxID=2800820 RepID=A0ABS7SF24_9MICO|nr:hypothetical protein [Occultella gossypii]MBZ2198944.1 hypothetical protein [Occultella gossypii]
MDFLQPALNRQRQRGGRGGQVPTPPSGEVDARQRAREQELLAAERARQEQEEREQLAVLEQQRLAAEAKLRAEEQRLREEAKAKRLAEEQRLREEAEAKRLAEEQRLREEAEAKRLAEEQRLREAQAQQLAESEWAAFLKAVADVLAQELAVAVGPTCWKELLATEQADALGAVAAAADRPFAEKKALEQRAQPRNRKSKRLEDAALAQAVRAGLLTDGRAAIAKAAQALIATAKQRIRSREEQQAAARFAARLTSTELNGLRTTPIPSGENLTVLYRAVAQNQIELVHSSTYRTTFEQKEKKGSTHGPFSREYSVRVYGTDSRSPGRYEWCSWVVHVHFRSSKQPSAVEYLHLKKAADRMKQINHVINNALETSLTPLVTATVDASKDATLPDIGK